MNSDMNLVRSSVIDFKDRDEIVSYLKSLRDRIVGEFERLEGGGEFQNWYFLIYF